MNLTAGTTLQKGKYLIRSVLTQTQFGCTYRATHVYLDQTVILQTLHPEWRDRPDFAQWRQHFMTSVKQLRKRQPPLPAKMVDCFEEGGFPFLVLERLSEQTLPTVEDWLSPLPTAESTSRPTDSPAAETPSVSPTAPASVAAPAASPAETTPALTPALSNTNGISQPENHNAAPQFSPTVIQNPTMIQTVTMPVELPSFDPIALEDAPEEQTNAAIASNRSTTAAGNPWQVMPQPKRQKTKPVLPLALLITALVGGIGGASFGLSLRFGQSAAAPSANESGNLPILDNGLFGSDQDFPPQADWPGEGLTETTEISPPPDMPIEDEPVHTPVRRNRSVGNYNPAPSERLPRAPEPSADEPDPLPSEPLWDEPAPVDQPPMDIPPPVANPPLPETNAVTAPAPPIDFNQVKPIPPSSAEPSQPSGSIKTPTSLPPAVSPPATIAPPNGEPGADNP